MTKLFAVALTITCLSFAFYACSHAARVSDWRLNPFKQKIDYDDAMRNEQRDGLVDIDFRKLKAPEFAKTWPDIDSKSWNFRKSDYRGEHYYYRWGVDGMESGAVVTARVCVSYEVAQGMFLGMAKNTSMLELPWIACSKKIGTVCAKSDDNRTLFFAYKNVAIEIRCDYALSGHEDFGEVLAEWLFNALKEAPLKRRLLW